MEDRSLLKITSLSVLQGEEEDQHIPIHCLQYHMDVDKPVNMAATQEQALPLLSRVEKDHRIVLVVEDSKETAMITQKEIALEEKEDIPS